jgi:hypothetical protein
MAKLVDALCSGRSVRKDVLVRIQFWAPSQKALKVFTFKAFVIYRHIYLRILMLPANTLQLNPRNKALTFSSQGVQDFLNKDHKG